jgi:hypothetical protein
MTTPFQIAIDAEERRAWKTAAARRDPDGVAPRLLFQQGPEGNRSQVRVA